MTNYLDLNYFHDTQFIQNEISNIDSGNNVSSRYVPLENTPILAGTLTGTIYIGNNAVQAFIIQTSGSFSFVPIIFPGSIARAIDGIIDLNTGEITLTWNRSPGLNHIVVSYEYNLESGRWYPDDFEQTDSNAWIKLGF